MDESNPHIHQTAPPEAPCFSYGDEGGVPSFLVFYMFKCYTLNIGKTVVA